MFRVFEKEGEQGNGSGTEKELEGQDFLEIEQDDEAPAEGPKEGEPGYVAPVIHAAPKSFDFGRLKALNPDLEEDEDKAYGWIESQVKENQNLRLLAKGREVIEQDPDIIAWHGHLKKDEESLFKTSEIIAGINAGDSKEDAEKAADEKYERLKGNNPDAITDRVRQVKAMLKGNIATKEKEILGAQEAARKNISPAKVSKEVSESAVGEVAKLNSPLGIKLSFKDAAKAKVLTDKAERAISSGDFMKKLNTDPAFLAKMAFIAENEAEYIKNIKSLGAGKAKILNALNNKAEGGVKPKPGGSAAGAQKGEKSNTDAIRDSNW